MIGIDFGKKHNFKKLKKKIYNNIINFNKP